MENPTALVRNLYSPKAIFSIRAKPDLSVTDVFTRIESLAFINSTVIPSRPVPVSLLILIEMVPFFSWAIAERDVKAAIMINARLRMSEIFSKQLIFSCITILKQEQQLYDRVNGLNKSTT